VPLCLTSFFFFFERGSSLSNIIHFFYLFNVINLFIKIFFVQWLTPVILATQEAEIRRAAVQNQPRQIVCKTLSPKTLHTHTHTNRACGVAQGEGPEFKP
jgi:hypothetical protein